MRRSSLDIVRRTLPLPALVTTNIVVASSSAGYALIPGIFLTASLCGIGAWLAFERLGLRAAGLSHGAAMVLGAQLGMLIGLAFDFGPFALVILSSWCAANESVVGTVRLMTTVAPGMHIGMLLGGLLGAALVAPPTVPRVIAASISMAVAIPLSDVLGWSFTRAFADSRGLSMYLCHFVAMSFVMTIAWLARSRTRASVQWPLGRSSLLARHSS